MKKFPVKNWEAIVGVVIIVVTFYAGKHSAPTKVETKVVTVEVEKAKVVEKKVIVEKVNKDGSKTTVTTIDTNTEKERSSAASNISSKENKKSPLNVSVMGGLDISDPANGFIVGAHVTKQLLGPISFGLFGLTNGTAGVSVGFSF